MTDDEKNAAAELTQAQLLGRIPDHLHVTREFLITIDLGGPTHRVIGSVVAEMVNALGVLETRLHNLEHP